MYLLAAENVHYEKREVKTLWQIGTQIIQKEIKVKQKVGR